MANPRQITIDTSKGDTKLSSISVAINDNSLENLIKSLQEAKELSNKYLTELVNEEKSQVKPSNSRKIDELVSSDEDIEEESTSKKLKKDNITIVNSEENTA